MLPSENDKAKWQKSSPNFLPELDLAGFVKTAAIWLAPKPKFWYSPSACMAKLKSISANRHHLTAIASISISVICYMHPTLSRQCLWQSINNVTMHSSWRSPEGGTIHHHHCINIIHFQTLTSKESLLLILYQVLLCCLQQFLQFQKWTLLVELETQFNAMCLQEWEKGDSSIKITFSSSTLWSQPTLWFNSRKNQMVHG